MRHHALWGGGGGIPAFDPAPETVLGTFCLEIRFPVTFFLKTQAKLILIRLCNIGAYRAAQGRNPMNQVHKPDANRQP
jgi:hypothetical protein